MSLEKEKLRKLKDEAARFLSKGKYEKALRNLQKVRQADPEDLSVYNNIGYLLRRLGKHGEAARVFEELGRRLYDRGFLLRAAAAYKIVLEIEPDNEKVQQKLAEICSCREKGVPLKLQRPCQGLDENSQAEDEKLQDLAMEQARALQEQSRPEESPGGTSEEQDSDGDFEIVVTTPIEELQDFVDGEEVELEIPLDISEQQELEPQPEETQVTLPSIPFLGELEQEAFTECVKRMKLINARKGDWIVREGAIGDSMFVVTSGQVRVLKRLDERRMWQLAVLGEGSFFGEMALLRGGRRSASVQATAATQLLEIDRELISELIERYPSVGQTLDKFMTQRLLRNVMNMCPIFAPFDRDERIRLIERFVLRPVEAGDALVVQDEQSDGLFVVLRGSFKVLRTMEDGKEIEVGSLHEGDIFGEISCLHKKPATASVKAETDGMVLRLPRQDFDELVMGHPQMLETIDKLGERHLSTTLDRLAAKGVLI